MVIKVYISGISASQEVKKRQQRVLLILDSVQVDYESVDITEPGREEERQWVQQTCKERPNPLPPQIFNDDLYLGDYEDFNSAVDIDKVLAFLKLDSGEGEVASKAENHFQAQNGRSENVKEDESEIALTEEQAETEENVDEANEKEIPRENKVEVVNETNGNDDRREDEAVMEDDISDHAGEELMEEEEEEKEDENEEEED